MKTLYITRGNNILIDEEYNKCEHLDTQRQGIDAIYFAKEPMHVVYGYGEHNESMDVEAEDIIVTFYVDDFKKRMVVIRSEEWANNLKEYTNKLQEEKERWAKNKIEDEKEN